MSIGDIFTKLSSKAIPSDLFKRIEEAQREALGKAEYFDELSERLRKTAESYYRRGREFRDQEFINRAAQYWQRYKRYRRIATGYHEKYLRLEDVKARMLLTTDEHRIKDIWVKAMALIQFSPEEAFLTGKSIEEELDRILGSEELLREETDLRSLEREMEEAFEGEKLPSEGGQSLEGLGRVEERKGIGEVEAA